MRLPNFSRWKDLALNLVSKIKPVEEEVDPNDPLGLGDIGGVHVPEINHRDWARRIMSPTMLARYEQRQVEQVVMWEKLTKQEVIRQFFVDRSISLAPFSHSLTGVAMESGCGFSALAFLTCEHPELIKLNYPKKGISADEMVSYLREKGYEVTDLNDELLKPVNDWMTNYLTSRNVILVCTRATADKNTWGVVWGDHLIHVWKPEEIKSTTFLNHHPLHRFLIWHPSWVSDNDVFEKIKKAKKKEKVEEEGYHNQTHKDSDDHHRDNALKKALFDDDVSKLVR